MFQRRKLKDRHRRFSFLTDLGGILSFFGELRGVGYPPQPRLDREAHSRQTADAFDEAWFVETIKSLVAHDSENSMEYPFYGEKIFDEPIVGFVRGDDPIFQEFKKIIGPHHFTPEEIMAWQARKNDVEAPTGKELSVVSFVLPISPKTREDNSRNSQWLAERWAQTRLHGEMYSQILVRRIVTQLMARGVLAVSPDVTPLFRKQRYPGIGWGSPWSHRHIAYAAGLGTFGMHDFLITEKGCAHRLGSFVVNLQLEPGRQRPADIHAHCLHHQGSKCLACGRRCPADAISAEGAHDKEKCYQKVAQSLPYCNRHFHIFIYGCGLCSTGVPCEFRSPVKTEEADP